MSRRKLERGRCELRRWAGNNSASTRMAAFQWGVDFVAVPKPDGQRVAHHGRLDVQSAFHMHVALAGHRERNSSLSWMAAETYPRSTTRYPWCSKNCVAVSVSRTISLTRTALARFSSSRTINRPMPEPRRLAATATDRSSAVVPRHCKGPTPMISSSSQAMTNSGCKESRLQIGSPAICGTCGWRQHRLPS